MNFVYCIINFRKYKQGKRKFPVFSFCIFVKYCFTNIFPLMMTDLTYNPMKMLFFLYLEEKNSSALVIFRKLDYILLCDKENIRGTWCGYGKLPRPKWSICC